MTHRNARYLTYVRSLTCCVCGFAPVEAAHLRMGQGGGMGLKPSDYRALPLCRVCHGEQHQGGERAFWQREKIDPRRVMLRCMAGYLKDACQREPGIPTIVAADQVAPTLLELLRLIEDQRPERFRKTKGGAA